MRVLAAGSLRGVWPSLLRHFPEPVETAFGPAGLLQERIAAGEACDLFASANLAHPRALNPLAVIPFACNSLCLTVRSDVLQQGDDWLSLLTRADLRLATSTAGEDPCGDYAQTLFDRMGDSGEGVRARARGLVGGRHSAPIPAGKLAAEWIIHSGQAELFIGYASYASRLRTIPGLTVIPLPAPYNSCAEYGCAVITPSGQRLGMFLQSEIAKGILREAGFEA